MWDGGVGPVAGDAVNPSMGAWSPHPCGSHPCHRTHPAFDSFLRFVGAGAVRCFWWVSTLVDTVGPRHAWMMGSDENESPFIFRTLPIPVVGQDLASLGH
ncbi:hypothetical protein SSKA14_2748 [Stenotrophomonas sp. SKA14]|nr:hypothetical protein SSKA14_2748 [Stenotrophomonas sp. SKA14]